MSPQTRDKAERGGRLAAADILRVLCIAMVAWYHFWQQSWLDPGFRIGEVYINLCRLVRNSYMFVDVLLVLTGFLLALPWAKARRSDLPDQPVGDFYGKRFRRIYPSYLFAVAVSVCVWAIPQGLYSSAETLIKDVLYHLTFLHNLNYDTYFGTQIPGVLWTLAVEVQFYVLFPLIARLYRDRPLLTCLVLCLTGWSFRLWAYFQPSTVMLVNQMPAMLDLFACGMGAAWFYTGLSEKPQKHGPLFSAGALLSLCVIFQIVYQQYVGDYELVRRSQLLWRFPIGAAGGMFLLCGCLVPSGVSRAVGNPVTRFLSGISYNFYIWHQFLAVRLKQWHIPDYISDSPNMTGEQPWQNRYMLLCFLAAAAAGTAVTYLIERPAAKRLRKTVESGEHEK